LLVTTVPYKGSEKDRECSTHWRDENAYRILVRKPEGKKPLGRPRHRREDNIRMDLREIGRECVDWMHLAQGKNKWRGIS
jgi:hypothetical protein